MRKTFCLKSIFLLFTLLAGIVSAQAEDYDYEWVKVTDLSEVNTGDLVVVTSEDKVALRNDELLSVFATSVEISDEKILDENVTDNIKWTLTKQVDETGDYFVFTGINSSYLSVEPDGNGNYDVVIGATDPDFSTKDFSFKDYGSNGGQLYFNNNYYIKLVSISNGDYKAVVERNSGSNFTLYKRTVKNYVKWKKVSNDLLPVDGEVVVVVDLNTETAMSNDKADKDPDAVAMNLNDDKDRILGDVAEKVQWTFNIPSEGNTTGPRFQFVKIDSNDYLYADSNGLKVGNDSDKDKDFTQSSIDDVWYLKITTGEKDYLAGVEESMFSNSWKLKELKDGKPDDKVKNTRFAFFKKVEDTQRVVKIELAEYYNYDVNKQDEYTLYERDFKDKVTITGAEKSDINWSSSNTDVATINEQGVITLIKRGTTVITASVDEKPDHDKASAKCTVIVDDLLSADPGTLKNPLTVAEAKELAETGKLKHDDIEVLTLEKGVNYYIKGKVSKVNSGMMAMFGDMDFGEMMGDSGSGMNFEDSMDDMDFDPEDMEESGFDMSSMGFDMSAMGFDMSAMFGTSDKVTYYISDDGTKDGQMKVIDGCGTLSEESTGGTMVFNPIPKLSAGDCVVVCGPLVYTEDSNMFSGMMSNNDSEGPKMSGKVDEMNYLAVYDPTLLVEDQEIYVDETLAVEDGRYTDYTLSKGIYSIDNLFERFNEEKIPDLSMIKEATFKSSDEEIAKWDEEKQQIIGVKEGKAKITVKVKVVLQEPDDNADPKVEEKSYTMKRKFKVIVKTRDLDPAGYYDGDYVLTTSTADLENGTRLILAGTRVKEGKEDTDYIMVENNAMMGGGKNGSKYVFDDETKEKIPCEKRPKGTLEIVLEQVENETGKWYLNVGEDENGEKLYLYASDSSEVEEESEGEGEGEGGNQFDFGKIMEMFSSSSGLKVGTKAEAISEEGVDSCMVTITFDGDIATIKFINVVGKNKAGETVDKSNTIMLSSSFDMEEMMNMFSSTGEGEGEGEGQEGQEGQQGSGSTFDMGSFDMFMAAFNTKKPGDEKSFMPRIYRFVPDPEFNVPIGATGWKTIVTYKDVEVPENVKAYVVTKVTPDENDDSKAHLKEIKEKQLKSGNPYLLYTEAGAGDYTMTLLSDEDSENLSAPKKNMLEISDRKTSGVKGETSVYVLANKAKGVGFYKWTGGKLGKGRVYLPIGASVGGAGEFCAFTDDDSQTDAIQEIDLSELKDVPCYDLQGRRVKTLKKGVYIVNGQKVIIK